MSNVAQIAEFRSKKEADQLTSRFEDSVFDLLAADAEGVAPENLTQAIIHLHEALLLVS